MNSPNHTHEFGKIFSDDSSCGKRTRLIRRCRICGYTEVVGFSGNITEHNFSKPEIIKPSTCSSPGEAILTCTKCGEQKFISLPITNHQYQCNNPFYKKCTICQKAELTPFARRSLAISGTCLIIAGGTIIAISALSSSTQNASIIAENSETVISEADYISSEYVSEQIYTQSSEKSETNSLSIASSDKSDSQEESLYTKYIVPEKYIPSSSSKDISFESENTEKFDSEASTSTQAEAPSEEASAPSETIPETTLPETENFKVSSSISAVSETQSYDTSVESSVQPSETAVSTETIEATETETTKSAETTTAPPDYSYLIGKLFYGNEILDYIDAGISIEIITNHGEKYYANVGESNFDSSVIISTDLYTVNTGTYEDQTIVIFNQL